MALECPARQTAPSLTQRTARIRALHNAFAPSLSRVPRAPAAALRPAAGAPSRCACPPALSGGAHRPCRSWGLTRPAVLVLGKGVPHFQRRCPSRQLGGGGGGLEWLCEIRMHMGLFTPRVGPHRPRLDPTRTCLAPNPSTVLPLRAPSTGEGGGSGPRLPTPLTPYPRLCH